MKQARLWLQTLLLCLLLPPLVVGLFYLVLEARELNAHLASVQADLQRSVAVHERTERAVNDALKRFGLGIE